ncbi:MAG: hypothetical protein E6R03_03385 [Hyphomicrobiaceae bacterium]|nr:MAG: hypothetical protein E6R03_03385 [Hyphomicrobiaceae bacterium]
MKNRRTPRGAARILHMAQALVVDAMVVLGQALMWCVALWVVYHITVFVMALIMWCQADNPPPPYY